MKYKVILNGCSPTYLSQAEETSAFIAANLKDQPEGETLIFYDDPHLKENLVASAPTTPVQLVRINRYQPETVLAVLQQIETGKKADIYLFPGSFAGRELAVRFACRVNGSSLVAVDRLELNAENPVTLTCFKAVYGSYLQTTLSLNKKPFCIAVSRGASVNLPGSNDRAGDVRDYDMRSIDYGTFCSDYSITIPETESDLKKARFILAVGRGVRSRKNIEKLAQVAANLGAVLGVSRPVAMSAWAPLSLLIGVSGEITAPQICIAAAVSGTAAFYKGIENSGKIIAINTNQEAPIVQAADVAVVDDYEAVLEELATIVQKENLQQKQ
jgi:electron transfer flavoprotein alpha subunit